MPKLDTHDTDAVSGAIYFIVGRGTEGGTNSYQMSIAGITSNAAELRWGKVEDVKADSGYSLGAIQVDLGQRGAWALGSIKKTAPKPGEQSYVDAIIRESTAFASAHGLKYTKDQPRLRADLMTHGNGLEGRSALVFIDKDTRDSINAWASSEEGKRWIHRNIDYPQIRHAARSAMDLLDKYGKNVSDDHRLQSIAILAKTENQMPAKMKVFEKVLSGGGDYDDLLAEARRIAGRHGYYAGLKAAELAERYQLVRTDPERAEALDRAQIKVSAAGFDPSSAGEDADIQVALMAIGQMPAVHVLRKGSHGDGVVALQTNLARLGITDAHGRGLQPDGAFGASTREAVVAFQRAHGLKGDGLAGPRTLETLDEAIRQQGVSLADRRHPGHALFCQALEQVHLIDAKCGRTPDELSNNLAGALVTAARGRGLAGIDHVVLGENATRAFAVQGELDSPFRQVAGVDILQAVAKPLAQSSVEFHASAQPVGPHVEELRHQQVALPASAQAISH